MEARVEQQAHHFYKMGSVAGKRSLDWDLNDWKWDGDLFVARPLNLVAAADYRSHQLSPMDNGVSIAGNSSNCSSSCSDETILGAENRPRETEKHGRVIVIDDEPNGLSLKLGGRGFPVAESDAGDWERNNNKKAKVSGGSTNRSVCQVEDCGANLSSAKDYHRRHKVCELHSKTSEALVGGILQRFCQQCSRFHSLSEFDEGKRSCRRRLAGHNSRRRKTNPESTPNANTLNDEQASSYLLISLLKILSSMHTNQSREAPDQDLLTHIIQSLANNHGGPGEKNISAILQGSQGILNGGQAALTKSEVISTVLSKGLEGPPLLSLPQAGEPSLPLIPNAGDATRGQSKLNNFDLNDIYVDSVDGMDDLERSPVPATLGGNSLDCPPWMRRESHQSSPPQTSGISDSTCAQSPSSSSGDTLSRTDRIVFKLFGKEPNDFPSLLRSQILGWLSHSPTDIESHIRPGCIILTIYLRQPEDAWEELSYDLSSSLSRLLDVSDDIFWKNGWAYIRVQHQIALVYEGNVVIEKSLPLLDMSCSSILSIRPIAVSASEKTEFFVKGLNLCQPASRLLCALGGKYLIQQTIEELIDENDSQDVQEEMQCVKFSCSIPATTCRGFIEIEDSGLSGSFFPFIVAEENVCLEIRALEDVLDPSGSEIDARGTAMLEAKNQALDFIHEMGWILHRNGVRDRLGDLDPNTDLFSFRRFERLVEFSMDHDWCSVVKKLLDILFNGTVGAGDQPSSHAAVLELGLVHRAVRRNSRPLVELLLRYAPSSVSEGVEEEMRSFYEGSGQKFLFRPDVAGPAGLTPLHIVAGKDGSEDMLDALTDDPGMIGVDAWKTARDRTGSTPEDYARLRGHYSYIHLVQKKINKRNSALHVVVDIPNATHEETISQEQTKGPSTSLEIGKVRSRMVQQKSCRQCTTQKLTYGFGGRSLLYRPTMLSMVAIAAVCVCVALLFKSCPEVLYVFRPFRWEMLDYGSS